MICKTSISFGIISIILIISIVLLVYYKNNDDNKKDNKDNKDKEDKEDNIDSFIVTPYNNIIISNNAKIKSLLSELNSINPSITIKSDPALVDSEFKKNISSNIALQTDNMVNSYKISNDSAEKYINILDNNLTDLENIINNKKLKNINKTKYSRVKSLNNGMEMNLFSTPNTIFKDNTTGKITDSYLVNVNNGCLSVGASDYDVYKCNDKNIKQHFKMKHIINKIDYENNIDKAIPFDNVDESSINYPFTMIKSVNNDECLTNNHGTLTVQPCYSFVAQRWMPLPDEK